jgi:chromate reductase, NAD(P)H dehydrogenase (quinone)
MKILAFAGSNSSQSINKKLIHYVASLLNEPNLICVDINDYELPIYNIDTERVQGIPANAVSFAQQIDQSDVLIISLAEHNGSYTAVFKNLFDWISRIPNRKAWGDKPIFLMATSTGARGGMGVLEAAANRFPKNGATILDTFSLPSFNEQFSTETGICEGECKEQLLAKLNNYFSLKTD